MITVMQVFKDLGIFPDKKISWAVGATMASRYKMLYGVLPHKELHKKTSGSGSHCFAVYPDSWAGTIADAIATCECEMQAQRELF